MFKVNQRVRIIRTGGGRPEYFGCEATITAIPVPQEYWPRIQEVSRDCLLSVDGFHVQVAAPFFMIAPLLPPESDADFAVRQVADLKRLADRAPVSPVPQVIRQLTPEEMAYVLGGARGYTPKEIGEMFRKVGL